MKTLQLEEEEEAAVPSPWREWGFTALELEVAEQLVIFSQSCSRTSSTCRRTTPSAELSPPPASRSSSPRSVSVTASDAPSLPLPAVKKQVKDEGMVRLAAAPRRPEPMRYRLITEIYETTKEIKGCNKREEEEEDDEEEEEEEE
ncbi:hypothetical protein ABZP36_035203 [Zizania latifolia]